MSDGATFPSEARRDWMRPRLWWLVAPAVLFFLIPVVSLLASGFDRGGQGVITFQGDLTLTNYERIFTRALYYMAIWRSVWIGILVALVCLVIGYPLAFIITRSVKPSTTMLPVILVGGGAILISRDLPSASQVVRPENAGVANVIGAAIAQVGGEVDRIYAMEGRSRDEVLGEAKAEASASAVNAGADPASVKIMDIEEVPLAYLPGSATRIRVKAVGDLRMGEAAE
ncbi:hypothetical protein [Pseudogemmobacter sonorensis]|uniref:hypothetical protein n=1 Tax=Pseudogemmobacter sonorensis TaxID=2989681 RepID=UPI003687893F